MTRVWLPSSQKVSAAALLLAVFSGACGQGRLEGDVPPGGDGSDDPGMQPGSEPAAELSCEGASAVGDTPLRRLTKTQFNNTVRDLLGLDTDAAAGFPEDDRAGAFPANPKRAVTDAHVRRYLDAAEQLAREVVESGKLASLLPCSVEARDNLCAERFIREFGARAYRRPLSDAQVERLRAVYTAGSIDGFEAGIQLVVEAMLQAPGMLYHVELKPAAPSTAVMLDDHELAARLSYYIWQTMPDAALVEAAEGGALRTPEGLRAHAERLLSDSRAKLGLADFTSSWLGLSSIEFLAKDAEKYPGFSAELSRAMRDETLSFVDHVFTHENASLTQLITAPYSIVPDAVLPIYGITRPAGQSASEPLMLPPERAGLLTHPSVLAVHSPSDHTSPVKRGVYVLNNVLCHHVALPTNLQIPELPPLDPNQTTRDRFIQHEQPGCAGCHVPIDHLGFAYERFDPIGAYREREGNQSIDDTGALRIGSSADGDVQGAVEMAARIAEAPELRSCMVRQWHRYALGREESEADACTISALESDFSASNLNLRELMLAIVTQDSFRFRPGAPQ